MEFLKSISPGKALEIIESLSVTYRVEVVTIEDCLDRILADDIIANDDIPSFHRSLVDGFTLIANDTLGASETNPSFLYTKGEIKVGEAAEGVVENGQAMAISTGAMIPKGADSVVMEEYVRRTSDGIEVTKTVHKGENICFIGEDIRKGSVVLNQGKKITPFDIGLLSALGYSNIPVYERPHIGVISSGDEIIGINDTFKPGKVRDINGYTITNLLKREGAIPTFLGIVRDNLEALAGILATVHEFDMVLISGGSSKGERDFLTQSIEKLGGKILFHGINIKPGKPTIFATLQDKPVFGLPGHPASCAMVMLRFVFPMLWKLEGKKERYRQRIQGTLTSNIPSSIGIEEYVRVEIKEQGGAYYITPLFTKSSVISSFAKASGYVVVPQEKEGYEKDELIEVYLF